jgi:hypothetical protein
MEHAQMATFARQKIHEAEAHIAAIDRELVEIAAVLPLVDGAFRRQAWDARSQLIQDRTRTLLALQRLEGIVGGDSQILSKIL